MSVYGIERWVKHYPTIKKDRHGQIWCDTSVTAAGLRVFRMRMRNNKTRYFYWSEKDQTLRDSLGDVIHFSEKAS